MLVLTADSPVSLILYKLLSTMGLILEEPPLFIVGEPQQSFKNEDCGHFEASDIIKLTYVIILAAKSF